MSPPSTIDLDHMRAELQHQAGFHPLEHHAELDAHGGLGRRAAQIVQSADTHVAAPEGNTYIPHTRQFLVDVSLVEAAFGGSYTLELATNDVFGTAGVFTRSDLAGCPACQSRAAAGNIVQGVIVLPDDVVKALTGDKDLGGDGYKDVLQDIKKGIKARIISPGNTILAQIDRSNATPELLAENRIPKVTLRSAKVSHPTGDPDGPYLFYDWELHGDVFEGERKWYGKATAEH